VKVDAHVSFGPLSFLFREHDVYPATVIDGGMRNLYHIKLLGTHFLGDHRGSRTGGRSSPVHAVEGMGHGARNLQ
jgi:hypothetical protein